MIASPPVRRTVVVISVLSALAGVTVFVVGLALSPLFSAPLGAAAAYLVARFGMRPLHRRIAAARGQ